MSAEMWHVDANGKPYVETTTELIQALTRQWDTLKCNHQVTVVLFTRVLFPGADITDFDARDHSLLNKTSAGILYRDYYRVVANSLATVQVRRLISRLQSRLTEFKALVLGDTPASIGPAAVQFAKASGGNVLETMNLSLNALGRHYIDRSFSRTGLSLLVVTPGTGVFDVPKSLLDLTEKRILDDGVGCDMICLAEPGLHLTPLFRFVAKNKPSVPKVNERGAHLKIHEYCTSAWIHQMYYQGGDELIEGKRLNRPEELEKLEAIPTAALISDTLQVPTSAQLLSRLTVANVIPYEDRARAALYIEDLDRNVWSGNSKVRRRRIRYNSDSSMTSMRSSSVSPSRPHPPQSKLAKAIEDRRRGQAAKHDTGPNESTQSSESLPKKSASVTAFRTSGLDSTESHSDHALPNMAGISGNSKVDSSSQIISGPVAEMEPMPADTALHSQRTSTTGLNLSSSMGRSLEPDLVIGRRIIETNGLSSSLAHSAASLGKSVGTSKSIDVELTKSSTTGETPRSFSRRTRSATFQSRAEAWRVPSERDRPGKLNPFVPFEEASSVMDRMQLRWADAFPVALQGTQELFGSLWKSLCEPALLPLSTGVRPDEAALTKTHDFSNYNVMFFGNRDHDQARFESLVNQRISQCYQICEPVQSTDLANSINVLSQMGIGTPARKRFTKESQTSTSVIQTIWLTLGSVFHKLTYNENERVVGVTIYRPKITSAAAPAAVAITYSMCLQFESTWQPKMTVFEVASLTDYRWNYSDNREGDSENAGGEQETRMLRYWRVRHALVAKNESADEEAQFGLFLEDMNRIVGKRDGSKQDSSQFRVIVDDAQKPPNHNEVVAASLMADVGEKEVVVRYDSHFRLNRTFHLEVQWLEAAPCLVDAFVDRWKKRAESRGFRLVPTPILLGDQGSDTSDRPNPYRGMSHISLAYSPPSHAQTVKAMGSASLSPLQRAILVHFDYVFEIDFDVGRKGAHSTKRYMHRSGKSFVHVVEESAFEWYPNPLYFETRRRGIATDDTEDDGLLLTEMRAFCQDIPKLQNLWHDIKVASISATQRDVRVVLDEGWRPNVHRQHLNARAALKAVPPLQVAPTSENSSARGRQHVRSFSDIGFDISMLQYTDDDLTRGEGADHATERNPSKPVDISKNEPGFAKMFKGSPLTPLAPSPNMYDVNDLGAWGALLRTTAAPPKSEVIEYAKNLYETVTPRPSHAQIRSAIIQKWSTEAYYTVRSEVKKIGVTDES